jgi:hypothetical protein
MIIENILNSPWFHRGLFLLAIGSVILDMCGLL